MEEARVEYFRGKYFVSFMKNHPECKEILEEDSDLDAEDIANVLLGKNLLVRCDRVAVRAVAFGAMWILLGKRVWFFPNILAEEATLKELFGFWPKKDEEEPPKWTSRLFYTVVAVVVVMLLRRHAPDEAARARYQRRMSNIIDDVLEWSPKLALSCLMENQPPVNIREAANNSSDAAGPAHTEEADLEEAEDLTNPDIKR
ncbi:translocation protein-related [Raphanus sativus]|nr:translocation protein-related [Raphanus sativus]